MMFITICFPSRKRAITYLLGVSFLMIFLLMVISGPLSKSVPTKVRAPSDVMAGHNGRVFMTDKLIVRYLSTNRKEFFDNQDSGSAKTQRGQTINYTANYKFNRKGKKGLERYNILAYTNVLSIKYPKTSNRTLLGNNSSLKNVSLPKENFRKPLSIKVITRSRDPVHQHNKVNEVNNAQRQGQAGNKRDSNVSLNANSESKNDTDRPLEKQDLPHPQTRPEITGAKQQNKTLGSLPAKVGTGQKLNILQNKSLPMGQNASLLGLATADTHRQFRQDGISSRPPVLETTTGRRGIQNSLKTESNTHSNITHAKEEAIQHRQQPQQLQQHQQGQDNQQHKQVQNATESEQHSIISSRNQEARQSKKKPISFAKPLQIIVTSTHKKDPISPEKATETHQKSHQEDRTSQNNEGDYYQPDPGKGQQLILNTDEFPGGPSWKERWNERETTEIQGDPEDSDGNIWERHHQRQRFDEQNYEGEENSVLSSEDIRRGRGGVYKRLLNGVYAQKKEFHQQTPKAKHQEPDQRQPGTEKVREDACSGCFKRPYRFIINSPEVCRNLSHSEKGESKLDLLVLIVSMYENRNRRDAIRNSWTSVTANNTNPRVRYAFLLGHTSDEADAELSKERGVHKDLVVQNFIDAYRNLTLKTLMALEWTETYCPSARYIMKTDDDVYVNIKNILSNLIGVESYKNSIIGMCLVTASPDRNPESKWYVTRRQYPHEDYPGFCSGTGYIMPRAVAHNILNISPDVPFFYLEDVYIALCARKVGVRLKPVDGFNNMKYKIYPGFCDVYGTRYFYTSHGLAPEEMEDVWKRCG